MGDVLAAVGSVFPMVDAIHELYKISATMCHFSRDLTHLVVEMQTHIADLGLLMSSRAMHLVAHKDNPNVDPSHTVKDGIDRHLLLILADWKTSSKIIKRAFAPDKGIRRLTNEPTSHLTRNNAQSNSRMNIVGTSGPESDSAVSEQLRTPSQLAGDRWEKKLVGKVQSYRHDAKSAMTTAMDSFLRVIQVNKSTGDTSLAGVADGLAPDPTPLQMAEIHVDGMMKKYTIVEGSTNAINRFDLLSRLRWAINDKEELQNSIDKLGKHIDRFRRYLELQVPKSLNDAMPTTGPRRPYEASMTTEATVDLHAALGSINDQTMKNASFGIAIWRTCDKTRRDLNSYLGFRKVLKSDSSVFSLQKASGTGAEHIFVIIEQNAKAWHEDESLPSITSADQIALPLEVDQAEEFHQCGTIPSGGKMQFMHRVFVRGQAPQDTMTFAQLLDEDGPRRMLDPQALVDIFDMLIRAQIDLLEIEFIWQHQQLQNFKVFIQEVADTCPRAGDEWSSSVWRKPYWFCGLGDSPQQDPQDQGWKYGPRESIVKLGLVLFQLGKQSTYIAGLTSSGCPPTTEEMRKGALQILQSPGEWTAGVGLSDIVRSCLEAKVRNEGAVKDVLCDCLARLEILDEGF